MDVCFCGAPTRTWLDRGQDHRDRVPLVAGTDRKLCGNCSRICPLERRRHCHRGKCRSQCQGATTTIPIVFAVGIDPVGSGLVASLAKPGGNVTGLSIQANELAGKRLEFARELVPQLRRLAIMFNFGNAQPVLEMGETQAAARMLGLEVTPVVIQRAEDIAPAFQGLKARADALYVAV